MDSNLMVILLLFAISTISPIPKLLNGSDLTDNDFTDSLTVSQTILFNYKTKSANSATKSRHAANKEPPLPLYIGLKIHTETRSRMQLYNLELSVSYYRVLQLENQLANAVCDDNPSKGAVVPAQLRSGLFTVGALDNLDHNPTSSTVKGSFHGTGISLFQFPTAENPGIKQTDIR